METYIRKYHNILGQSNCNALIRMFDGLEHKHIKRDNEHYNFSELNFNELSDFNKGFVGGIYGILEEMVEKYIKDCNMMDKQFPLQYSFEDFRFKKYNKGEGFFNEHVDVGNHNSAKRFLVCMFYLNTVEEGGETEFSKQDFISKAEIDSLIMFPSTWTHPHSGNKPLSNDKYILSTYLHYV